MAKPGHRRVGWIDTVHNVFQVRICMYLVYANPTVYSDSFETLLKKYTPTLLYRGIFCIASFAYHANFGAQCPLAIVYVRHISRQTSNAQLHRKLSKMSRIMVNKCIPLQKSCRKLVSANTGYPFPMKCPLSPLKIHCFYFLRAGSVV